MLQSITTRECRAVQTEHEFGPRFYEAQIYFLEKEISQLKLDNARLASQPFGFFAVKDDKSCYYYTGLKIPVFTVIQEICYDIIQKTCIQKLNFKDEMLLVLMKLRLDLDYRDLAQ